jgi:hypothetical protein
VERLKTFLFYTILLSFVFSFISITLFEFFLILAIPIGVFLILKEKNKPGIFSIPLLGHLSVITLSSALFLRVKEQWVRLLEQDFFSLSYFATFGLDRKRAIRLAEYMILLSLPLGLLISAKVLYTYFSTGDFKAFWGGNFIIGNLLALPFFSTLYLFFFKGGSKFKYLYLLLGLLFLSVAFLPTQRSVILGFIVALIIFFIGIIKLWGFSKRLLLIVALVSLGSTVVIYNSPKVKAWIVNLSHGDINRFSSNRVIIAKGAFELIQKAWEDKDYTKLLIGWGYGPQKQYKNLPPGFQFINEYESFLPITAFINGGILNLIFIIWFYIAAVYLTYRVLKRKTSELFGVKLTLISAVWVNLIYHLFTLFWVPINAIFYILLALIEKIEET